jgi:signal transduction histidine kinase/ActR/RegA family two-component response regulator
VPAKTPQDDHAVAAESTDATDATDPASLIPAPSRRRRLEGAMRTKYVLSGLVFAVIATLTVVSTLLLRGSINSQERRLLNERVIELSSYLTASTAQSATSLSALSDAVAVSGPGTPLFQTLSSPLTHTATGAPNGATVGVAQRSAGSYRTVAATGTLAKVGTPLTADQQAVIARAASKPGLFFRVATAGGVRHILQAIKATGNAPTVAFQDRVLPTTTQPVPTTSDSPYRELNVSLYIGARADPAKLLLVYNGVPSGNPVRNVAKIGNSNLLFVTSAHTPLVGGFAQFAPWLVLAAGLVLAFLLALLVQVLTRRRAYALNLVEQRTRAMRQAQLAAEAANRSKSEFLSRMSHELRTPLNAVLGFSQLLELDELSGDQEQAVRQISKGGRHLLDLINEILDISQIETGKLALSPEALRVGDLIGESVELVQPLSVERGVHLLGSDLAMCDVYIFADRQRLKQILLNLLGNAIKYNREGGTVSISCARPESDTLRIQVTDTGPGIAPEHFGSLFTPFERLGAERTTVEGTGIGLALSHRLAEVMGGTLGVESTVGRGSTFWVDFKIVEGPVDRVERLGHVGAAAAVALTPAGDLPAILHIEDNLSNIQLIERVLAQRPGVRLIPAMQGRLGVELARQHRPVLVLLDLNLADISGEDVLRMLRDDPATAHTPVAIISADAMPRQAQRMLAAGATAYLTKPIDVRQLLELVDASLASRPGAATSLTSSSADPTMG